MITKGTKLYSVIHEKCPQCHEGEMFQHSPLSLKFMAMHKACPVCGFDFIQEPSFYFGAMYFSYAIQVVVLVAVYLVLRFTINPDTTSYIASTIVSLLLILPFNFRWSRLAWINLFASYKADAAKLVDK